MDADDRGADDLKANARKENDSQRSFAVVIAAAAAAAGATAITVAVDHTKLLDEAFFDLLAIALTEQILKMISLMREQDSAMP